MPSFLQNTIYHLLQLGHKGLDVIFPPRCLCCNAMVEKMGTLCPDCWQDISFNSPPYCAICSYPFEYEMGDAALCASCIAIPPPYSRAYTVFHYNEKSKTLIHSLKYADKTHSVPYLGQWMARTGSNALAKTDMIIPVPLHWQRLYKRRYNQAALLAQSIGKTCCIPVYADCLLRVKNTPFQSGLSSKERNRNVRGVFKLNPNYATMVKDKHIVLIDDVMTTGATLSACSKALLKAKARDVQVITLARTIKR